MDLSKLKQDFDKLTPQEQYDWLLKQDKATFTIYLDNDVTELSFHSDEECNYTFRFKRYLGDAAGVESLLKAMGFDAQCV